MTELLERFTRWSTFSPWFMVWLIGAMIVLAVLFAVFSVAS
jgi:hypothetical protein